MAPDIFAEGRGDAASAVAKPKQRLVLADDHRLLLEEVNRLLSPHFDVLCAVDDGQELFDATCEVQPDAVVSDLDMPVMDGITACRALRERGYNGGIVLLTMHAEELLVESAFSAGVDAYVLKTDAVQELIPAIHAALARKNYRSRRVRVKLQR
jgi:DNA-binding NarL/FixJ family response regulator